MAPIENPPPSPQGFRRDVFVGVLANIVFNVAIWVLIHLPKLDLLNRYFPQSYWGLGTLSFLTFIVCGVFTVKRTLTPEKIKTSIRVAVLVLSLLAPFLYSSVAIGGRLRATEIIFAGANQEWKGLSEKIIRHCRAIHPLVKLKHAEKLTEHDSSVSKSQQPNVVGVLRRTEDLPQPQLTFHPNPTMAKKVDATFPRIMADIKKGVLDDLQLTPNPAGETWPHKVAELTTLYLGLVLYSQNRYKQATKCFNPTEMNQSPDIQRYARLCLGLSHNRQGNYDDAVRQFRQIQGYPIAQFFLGRCYEKRYPNRAIAASSLEKTAEAYETALTEWHDLDKGMSVVERGYRILAGYFLGRIYHRQGRLQDADSTLKQAITEYENLSSTEKAKLDVSELNSQDIHELYYYQGRVHLSLARSDSGREQSQYLESAREAYHKATHAESDWIKTRAYCGLGQLDHLQKKYYEAIGKYKRAPNFLRSAEAHYGIGLSRRERTKILPEKQRAKKERDEAETELKKARYLQSKRQNKRPPQYLLLPLKSLRMGTVPITIEIFDEETALIITEDEFLKVRSDKQGELTLEFNQANLCYTGWLEFSKADRFILNQGYIHAQYTLTRIQPNEPLGKINLSTQSLIDIEGEFYGDLDPDSNISIPVLFWSNRIQIEISDIQETAIQLVKDGAPLVELVYNIQKRRLRNSNAWKDVIKIDEGQNQDLEITISNSNDQKVSNGTKFQIRKEGETWQVIRVSEG